ncbi:MAG: amino acid permease [Gemmatimonadetes bacterium]|nr:amino acid permease [Gemmatimonadota bacterium]
MPDTTSGTQLDRVISLNHATAMVVGTIIGAAIFVQPSEITGQVPSVPWIFAVWAVAGGLSLFGALVCAELASTFPASGGVYVYLRESFSPALGFLWGWAMFWTMHSGIIAAIAVVFARYAGYFVPLSDFGTRAIAVSAVLLISWVNYRGVRQGSVLQATFTWVKVLAILAIIAIGFAMGGDAHEAAVVSASSVSAVPGGGGGMALSDFGLALVAGLFAFGGWHMVTYSADETRNPRKTIPRALVIGMLIVTACYMALNAVYLHLLPFEAVATSERVAADAADAVFGTGGGAVMSAVVLFSAFGAVSGVILAGPRVYYAMAQDGLLFRWAGEVHSRYRTPHKAILLQALWSSVLVATGTYQALFRRAIYTEWIFFGLMALGIFIIRRRKDVRRDYSIWGHPWVPIIFALSAFGIVINQVLAEPVDSAVGLGLVLIGWPVYHFWSRKSYRSGVREEAS